MKKILLISLLMITITGCTEFAMLMSGGSVALTQNSYARAYNAIDLGVVITTKKGIKQHAYEKGKEYLEELAKAKATGKKYIVDWTKAKALGITTKH